MQVCALHGIWENGNFVSENMRYKNPPFTDNSITIKRQGAVICSRLKVNTNMDKWRNFL